MPSSVPRRTTSCSTPRAERALLGAALLAALLLLLPLEAQAQCAMCKTALTGSPEGRSMGEQFNRAILLMMAAPYVVIGAVGAVAFRGRLRLAAGRLAARLRAR